MTNRIVAAGRLENLPDTLEMIRAEGFGVAVINAESHHYRLTNPAGVKVEFWPTTTRFLVNGYDVGGHGVTRMIRETRDLAVKELPPFVTIFADASFCQQSGTAGWAAWIKAGRDAGVYVSGPITAVMPGAQEAETAALANALAKAKARHLIQKGSTVMLESDCLNGLAMIRLVCPRAVDRPAPGGLSVPRHRRLKRPDPALADIAARRDEFDLTLLLRHVKAHTGRDDPRSYINAQVDQLARRAMRDHRRATNAGAAE